MQAQDSRLPTPDSVSDCDCDAVSSRRVAGVFTATRIARSLGTGLDTDMPLARTRSLAVPFHSALAWLQLKIKRTHTQCTTNNTQNSPTHRVILLGVAFCIQHRNRGAASQEAQRRQQSRGGERERVRERRLLRIVVGFGIRSRGTSHANSSLNFAQSQKFKTPNQTDFFWGLSGRFPIGCPTQWMWLVGEEVKFSIFV